MQDFRKLKVWEHGHRVTMQVYQVTRSFPKEKLYGLTSQLRRASASIPANIAEGCGRGGDAEFGRFLQIAMGSACEVEYHLLLAHDLNYLSDANYQPLSLKMVGIKRMLTALIQRVKS